MSDIAKLIEKIPVNIKQDIIDFHDTAIDTGEKKGIATRVVVGRILTEEELKELETDRMILCDKTFIAYHRNAPEIKYSYFYVWHYWNKKKNKEAV